MQDKVFVTDNAVILLDGATEPDATEHDGGWIADQLGQHLSEALANRPNASLTDVLADAIHAIAHRHRLKPGASPSTTVAIARWTADAVDLLVLGDSPIIVERADGSVVVVEDLRLSRLPGRTQFGPPQADASGLERARDLVAYERSCRNQPGGYWIAEADPSAAEHALHATIPRTRALAVLLISDGIADGVNHYHQPSTWSDALAIAQSGTKNLLDAVHAVEEADADCSRWPRSKVHDDKAAALVTFSCPQGVA